jgi:hypothetical protein
MGKLVKNRIIAALAAFLVLFLQLGPPAFAQEGHPYEGTWRGTLTSGAGNTAVVIIMDYDGENLQGMINPGRNSYNFLSALHDAPNWELDVTAETRQGDAVSFSAVMHEIGSVNRYMEGTWIQAGQQYAFRITRE